MKSSFSKYLATLAAIAVMFVTTACHAGGEETILETAVASNSFMKLIACVKNADLIDTLQGDGPFTVFAPTDEAFAKLTEGTFHTLLKPENRDKLVSILTYHVVPGKVLAKQVADLDGAVTVNGQRVSLSASKDGVTVGGANVIQADIQCSNGVIHVIDSVILPAEKNLVETASSAGIFNTLIAAAKAAGLADALIGDKALTIFAPTDEAFEKLPKGTVESLLKAENRDKLVEILTYHVVAGRVYSGDVAKQESLASLQGSPITVKAKKKGVRIQKAKLLKADIDASNGVIHVINKVIMPPKKAKVDNSTAIDARTLIKLAVVMGSHLFNDGDHQGCNDVYTTALQELLDSKTGVSEERKEDIRSTLSKAKHTSRTTSKSWVLRYGLQDVYHSLPSTTQSQEVAAESESFELLQADQPRNWYTVNDGVMGGKSEGDVKVNDSGTIVFSGNLSLRNNGGFASTRIKPEELNIEEGDTLVARVRGDGREYAMNIYDNTRRMAFSYRAPLKTVKGELIDVRIPLSDFYATSFGRRLNGVKLNASEVNSFGFILADKQSGPFRLEIESIQVEKAE